MACFQYFKLVYYFASSFIVLKKLYLIIAREFPMIVCSVIALYFYFLSFCYLALVSDHLEICLDFRMHHCTPQVFIVVCQTLNYYLEFLYIFSLIHFLKYLFFSLFFFSENHLSLSIIFIYDPKHYIFLLDYI